jgi:hypothetical protein
MSRFKTVVIDADQMCYAIGFAAKGEPISHALATVKSALKKIQEQCDADERVLFVKGKGNFREDIAITRGYKAQRKETDKPAHYEAIYDYLINVQGAVVCDGMEADDVVSIRLYEDFLLAEGDRDKATLVLSSGDKDLNNTPGWHHNPRTGEVVWISDLQATRHFFYQMLMGDMTDNIKGIPSLPFHITHKYGLSKKGVGKASAKKLMATTTGFFDAETMVYEMYLHWGESEGLTEQEIRDYILENAQLLWMVRKLDGYGKPAMFQINEGCYEEAKRRSEFGGVSDTERSGEADYRTEGWGSEDILKPDDSLRIIPSGVS